MKVELISESFYLLARVLMSIKNPSNELKFTSFILKPLFLLLGNLGNKFFDEKICLKLSAVMPKEFFLLFDELDDQYLVLLANPWAPAS